MSDMTGRDDQIKAAVADARQRLAAGGPAREAVDGQYPAIDRLKELLSARLDVGHLEDCGHFPPRFAQPVHWLPAIPDMWHCETCAQRLIDDWLKIDYHKCDLCQRTLIGEHAPTLIYATLGMVIAHAVTCAGCAPEDDGA